MQRQNVWYHWCVATLPSLSDIEARLDEGDVEGARTLVQTLHAVAQDLRERNLELREQLAASAGPTMAYQGGLYWRVGPGDHREGPFCQQCQDANGKASRLQASVAIGGAHQWWCSVCGSQYNRD